MDKDTEIWDEFFPHRFHDLIWKPWQHCTNSRQWCMGLSCRLEPPMLKQPRVQVPSDISHEQNPQVSIKMFPQSKNQQTPHRETGVPHFQSQSAPTNPTAAPRIPNYRGSLASLLRLHCSLAPQGTHKRVHLRLKILYQSP